MCVWEEEREEGNTMKSFKAEERKRELCKAAEEYVIFG